MTTPLAGAQTRMAKKTAKKTAKRRTADNAGGESIGDRRKRMKRIIARLKKLYPDADCALVHRSALELLIATILSAPSTDVTVNKVTPVLFKRYPTAVELAAARPADVEKIIHATGFFRQKTKSVINACKAIVEQFGGEVPATLEELIQLPGVARKTANVVLGTGFGRSEGMVVDTHIGRLAHRLGMTWTSKNEKDAVKIEQDLMQVIPRSAWINMGHALIWHGRRVCPARKPDCAACTLNKLCPAAFGWEPAATTKTGGRRSARTQPEGGI